MTVRPSNLDLLTAALVRRGWTVVTTGIMRLAEPAAVALLRVDGRGGRCFRWTPARYDGPSATFSGNPERAARKIDDYARGVVRSAPAHQLALWSAA